MSKRLTILLLLLLGAVLFLAHTTQAQEIKLFATKVELTGEVKLVWTSPISANNTTVYYLHRAKLPDTASVIVSSSQDTMFVDRVPPSLSSIPQSYAYRVTAKTGTTIEQSNIIIVPVPGIPLIGSFKLEGKIDSGKIKLFWQKPPVGDVSYYLVYRGYAGDGTPINTLIDSTTNQWSITDTPIAPDPNKPTVLVFYVKAKLTTGEMIVSTTLQLTTHPRPTGDELMFVSIPSMYGQKNVRYQYTASAVSKDNNAIIRYYSEASLNASLTFTIDSISGVVDWIPATKGLFRIKIIARSDKGGMAKQEFVVSVSDGNGIIQGKISDTLNAGIPGAIVEIYKTDNNTTISFGYVAKTDANGNYRINRIDPGKYKLRANAPSAKYQSQWYEGKRDVTQADIVTVIDSPAVVIANFKLRSGVDHGPKFTISGKITDTAGFAINSSECRVIFVRAEFALNIGGGMQMDLENLRKYFDFNKHHDFRLEGNSEFVFKAKLDSLGKYHVDVPPGRYIGFARAKGYAVQFYENETNLLSADIIRVNQNLSGIDFILSPLPPVVLGEISGSVLDSIKDIAVPARVIAFRDGWRFHDKHRISRTYVTDTDSTGTYVFEDLLPGKYVVMALPLGNYAPAFYSDDTVNVRWKKATRIEINGNSVDNINIYVRPLAPSINGYAAINGRVSVGGGSGSMNSGVRAGAIVYAYRNGEIAGYTITNTEGDYSITGLSPGSYSVFVDKAGYNESNSMTVNTTYDINGNPVNGTADFTITAVLNVTANTTILPEKFLLEQNYPNPFNPSTTIGFSLPQSGEMSLRVYNVVGQEVTTLLSGFQNAGQYSVTFNATHLASGVYFYRLNTGSFGEVKKMLLLK